MCGVPQGSVLGPLSTPTSASLHVGYVDTERASAAVQGVGVWGCPLLLQIRLFQVEGARAPDEHTGHGSQRGKVNLLVR